LQFPEATGPSRGGGLLEELAQEPDVAAVRGAACELGGKVGQVLLQHGPVDISQSLEAQRCALEEARERVSAPTHRPPRWLRARR